MMKNDNDEKDEATGTKRRKISSEGDASACPSSDMVPDSEVSEGEEKSDGEAESWTLERLMHRFQTSEEIHQYLAHNRDIGLLRFLENLQEMNRVQPRRKLSNINDLRDVRRLVRESRKILVLTGAGVSVSAGLPDFRSANGIYARLREEFMMPSPTCMFDIDYFNKNPGPFFNFASELWPGRFKPTKSHLFIAELERRGKLLRNYTQNIDTLEHQAGCHSSYIRFLFLEYF